ncbi:F-box/WD repeat-containing protein 10-like isoform X5 [Cyanistes caeruleus]|uniref:F-box/WD repeat-containing protein 10-like isoform X5 n=1 Tax=Cyanistes caeruleus TaxID=156563 RepID=UPI000CDB50C7|nr:F-box/WD repeat-containing protein 10-like isoform X5 [Cyanistes caeruleus]
MVPASLQSHSDVSQPKDFTRILPFHLSMSILGLLDQKSLDACSAVNGHWEFLVRQVREDQECRSTVQKDLLQLQELCPRKAIPNYAKRVDVQIPQLNDEGEVVEVKAKEQTKRYKSKTEDFSLHEAYRELKTQKIELEERNVFCGPYKTRVLLDQCWNIHSGVCVRTFTGHYATVTCLDSHQEHVVSGAGDGMVKAVWSLKSGNCLRTLMHNSPVWAVRMDGTHVVSGGHQGLVKVWSAETGALIKTLERHQGPVLCLSFDQWHLVTGSSDGYALGWSMLGKFRRCLIAFFHPKEVLSLEFLYLRVISGCADGHIRIFNFLTGTCLRVLEPSSSRDPVSDLYIAGNRVVTNSCSRLLLLQFEDVVWDYSLPTDREVQKKEKKPRKGKRQGASAEQQQAQDKSPKSRGRPKSGEAEQGPAPPAPEEAEATLEHELPQRNPSRPMSPDKFLLTIGTLQSSCKPAVSSPTPELSAEAREVQQQCPGQVPVAEVPLQQQQERAAQLWRAGLHSHSLTMTRISTLFETKRLRLRLKNSLHGPAVKSSIPPPCLVCPKFCGLLGERKIPRGHGKDTPGPKDGDQVIDLSAASLELIQPTLGMAAQMRNEAPRRIKPFCPHSSHRDSGLRLLTAEQEVWEATVAAQHQAQQAKPTEEKERARRKAWLRKTKGLPVDSFTGERKTLAPELGHNTFI